MLEISEGFIKLTAGTVNSVNVRSGASKGHERVDTSKANAARALHTPEGLSAVDEGADKSQSLGVGQLHRGD